MIEVNINNNYNNNYKLLRNTFNYISAKINTIAKIGCIDCVILNTIMILYGYSCDIYEQ